MTITKEMLQQFADHLRQEEKSPATSEKYLRDVGAFSLFAEDRPISKELVVQWKQHLIQQGYAVRSINSMLASVNGFLAFGGRSDCRVKNIRTQRQMYCAEEKNLTKAEYLRLLTAARENQQLWLLLQTICSTGIRVSELCCFTVEAVRQGQVRISCKGKIRHIFIPGKLKHLLLNFAKQQNIRSGTIFLNRRGNPLNRSWIWAAMKRLCQAAGVVSTKVFPHNLRKLFAKTYYATDKDIAKLADILGHSSINTTRIYIMTTGAEHQRQVDRLGLVIT